jgi:hypothetical protein
MKEAIKERSRGKFYILDGNSKIRDFSPEINKFNFLEFIKFSLLIHFSNRYRDIIDAADGIHVMKNCTKKVRFKYFFQTKSE